MYLKYKKLIAAFLMIMLFGVTIAQAQKIDSGLSLIGKPCPDFIFKRVFNYSKNQVALSDLIGKPFIIDLWASWCVPCVKEFPRMDSLQNEFEGELKIIPVGWDNEKNVETIFNRLLDKNLLNYHKLSAAFDKDFVKRINAGELISVWVDKNSIIRYYSSPQRITSKNLRDFIDGKPVKELEDLLATQKKANQATTENRFDPKEHLLVNGNGGHDSTFIFRSIITSYLEQAGWQGFPGWFSPKQAPPSFKIINLPLHFLYELAYRPQFCPNPVQSPMNMYGNFATNAILELSDLSDFKFYWRSQSPDSAKMNRYCYELTYPNLIQSAKISKQQLDSALAYVNSSDDKKSIEVFGLPTAYSLRMQQKMRQDLHDYFGYKVSIERRKFPCYYLEATDKARKKLKTKGDKQDSNENYLGLKMVNQPVSDLIAQLWFAKQFISYKEVDGIPQQVENIIIDKTKINGNIDIDLDCELSDLNALKIELNKNGLNLRKGQKEMGVVVIRNK